MEVRGETEVGFGLWAFGSSQSLEPRAGQRAHESRVLVLGIGNLLMGDEGVGVHAVRRLERELDAGGRASAR